jgi:hypothetical protein
MRSLAWVLLLGACRPEYGLVSNVDVDPAEVLPCGFTPVPDTDLRAYDCNPVFTGTDESWTDGLGAVAFRAQPLLGHALYQLWYTSPPKAGGGGWALGHAISANGVDWEPHPNNPLVVEDGGWDATSMDQLAVVWDARKQRYVLAYQGYRLDPVDSEFGMGVLTAPDAVSFTSPIGRYPVLDLSVVQNGKDYCWPLSLDWSPQGYKGLLAGHEVGDQRCQIYGFETGDISGPFQLTSQLVLPAGPEPYDKAGMASAAIVTPEEGPMLLFYVGFAAWVPVQENVVTPEGYSLNLATSSDGGRTWVKDPRNPLPIALQGEGPSHVAAQVVGPRVHLWVTADHPELGQQAVDYFIYDPPVPAGI